ncbi:MAG: hypothetical protein JSC189_000666 [Candidatus Tokpelaia sp. JSC189]|nr:MAG: hypothetical protein JSC189_000666 [Candidatus Tokpelaia sp. JSC189]
MIVFAYNNHWTILLPCLARQYDVYTICSWNKTNPMPIANRNYRSDTEIYVYAWKIG